MFLSDTNMAWLTGWSKRHTKDQNCCINVARGKSNYPKLMLYYTTTRKYCGKEANLQVTVVLCLPTLMGHCSPGHGSHWAKAGPGGNLRVSEANKNSSSGADSPLTILERKTTRYERLTEDLIQAGFDALNLPLKIGCQGVRNAAKFEYIYNQVWIGVIKKPLEELLW